MGEGKTVESVLGGENTEKGDETPADETAANVQGASQDHASAGEPTSNPLVRPDIIGQERSPKQPSTQGAEEYIPTGSVGGTGMGRPINLDKILRRKRRKGGWRRSK